jgi:alpha-ketoglutarate-dependent taurine dioxygenase
MRLRSWVNEMTTGPRFFNCENGWDLHSVEDEAVRQAFKESGALLFRGFAVTEQEFAEFAGRFIHRHLLDIGASKLLDPKGGVVQTVVPSGDAQGLHCENARYPDYPDQLWFFCERPARSAGETRLCDATVLWSLLSQPTRQMFLQKRLKYTETSPREMWRQGVDMFLGSTLRARNLAGTTYRFNDDESLTVEYVVPAVRPTRYGGVEAFVNSVTGPVQSGIAFEDSTTIPRETLDEIRSAQEQCSFYIQWSVGDLLMLDNTRYLHGRNAFSDENRRLLTVMGTANF